MKTNTMNGGLPGYFAVESGFGVTMTEGVVKSIALEVARDAARKSGRPAYVYEMVVGAKYEQA